MKNNILSISTWNDDDNNLNIEVVTLNSRLGLSFGKENYCYYINKNDDMLNVIIPEEIITQIINKLKEYNYG